MAKATLLNRSDKNKEKNPNTGLWNLQIKPLQWLKSSILLPYLERKLFSAPVGVIVCAKMWKNNEVTSAWSCTIEVILPLGRLHFLRNECREHLHVLKKSYFTVRLCIFLPHIYRNEKEGHVFACKRSKSNVGVKSKQDIKMAYNFHPPPPKWLISVFLNHPFFLWRTIYTVQVVGGLFS